MPAQAQLNTLTKAGLLKIVNTRHRNPEVDQYRTNVTYIVLSDEPRSSRPDAVEGRFDSWQFHSLHLNVDYASPRLNNCLLASKP